MSADKYRYRFVIPCVPHRERYKKIERAGYACLADGVPKISTVRETGIDSSTSINAREGDNVRNER